MPIEWSERFMGLNVPTITLGSNASNNEKILSLGVLLYSLRTIEIRKVERAFNEAEVVFICETL